jgi:signal transduction histidine kinase
MGGSSSHGTSPARLIERATFSSGSQWLMPPASGVHDPIGEAKDSAFVRILVVEDNRADAELLELHLEESPLTAELSVVPRLASAKALLARQSFDCVLLDLGLPDTRGVATLLSLREVAPDVPVVVLTGLSDIADASACVRRGAQEFLEKARLSPRTIAQAIELAMLRVSEASARRELIQADRLRSVGLLAAGIAHEVNNPLTVLGMTLRELTEELRPALPPELQAILDDGMRECRSDLQRIATTVGRLGSFSRADESQPPIAVALDDVARDALRLTEHHWSRHCEVETSLSRTPPVRGYPSELTQVVVNLVMNATQAMKTGGGTRILVMTRVDGATVELSVSDDGPGIDPSALERIFDPFYTTKGRGEGTGLGLAICRGIVKSHGGTLRARSRRGLGTTFTIRLPPSAEASAPKPPTDPPAKPEAAVRWRVLFVDDEPGLLRATQRLLQRDFDVATASSGEDAIALLETGRHFDAIFCDVSMPGMSGGAVYQWVADHRPELADHFVLTSGGAAEDVLATLPDVYRLGKPFDFARLRAMVESVATRSLDERSSTQ